MRLELVRVRPPAAPFSLAVERTEGVARARESVAPHAASTAASVGAAVLEAPLLLHRHAVAVHRRQRHGAAHRAHASLVRNARVQSRRSRAAVRQVLLTGWRLKHYLIQLPTCLTIKNTMIVSKKIEQVNKIKHN